MALTLRPEADTKFVILRDLKDGNKFFSTYSYGRDNTKIEDGTIAYTVLGYAATIGEAQVFLYGKPFTTTGNA